MPIGWKNRTEDGEPLYKGIDTYGIFKHHVYTSSSSDIPHFGSNDQWSKEFAIRIMFIPDVAKYQTSQKQILISNCQIKGQMGSKAPFEMAILPHNDTIAISLYTYHAPENTFKTEALHLNFRVSI